MTKESIQQFLSAFFPFLFGVHPYTCHTEKQLEAMRIAGVEIAEGSIYELTEAFVFRMLDKIQTENCKNAREAESTRAFLL